MNVPHNLGPQLGMNQATDLRDQHWRRYIVCAIAMSMYPASRKAEEVADASAGCRCSTQLENQPSSRWR